MPEGKQSVIFCG